MNFILKPGELTLADLRTLLDESTVLELDPAALPPIAAAEQIVHDVIAGGKTVYGINTGFGALAHTHIDAKQLDILQQSIVLSHATGTGELMPDAVVRLILALKINSLARGFSGVRLKTIEALIQLYNAHIYPCIPSQGSVGASGDLAPLAHLSAALLGVGTVRYQGQMINAVDALQQKGIALLKLAPKEGLALLNGTQVSTALGIFSLLKTADIFSAALTAGALSVDAVRGSDTPFDARIQAVRGQPGQIETARLLRELLKGSEIRESHRACQKVQDPYSLRCQPQVMGACLTQLEHAAHILLIESNAVSDNPLIFAPDNEVLSGGNFHAEPVALAADAIALAIAEIGALSERRIALLIDPQFSHLPAFLVRNPGINSGFMLAQVTAAALASENKSFAHPASVDSIPTSANQEDHVSMATFAARRLMHMCENTIGIVGIELLAACQGIDFARPLRTSAILEKIHTLIRSHVPFYAEDRFFAPDIAAIKELIHSGQIRNISQINIY